MIVALAICMSNLSHPSIRYHWLNRKPIWWRKGKRATAMRVRRPVAKKSTANQQYAISYLW